MAKRLRRSQAHSPDYAFIALFVGLVIFGLVMLASASSPVAFARFDDSYLYLKRQLVRGVLPGILVLLMLSRIDYRVWKKYAFGLLVATVILLVLVFIPGIGYTYGGATSWIEIGGLLFQPSEVAKLTFLLYLATWLERRGRDKVSDFSQGFVPFLLTLGVVMGLIIAQPDVGTMSIIVLMALVVYFVAGANWSHLGLVALGGAGLLLALIKAAPYRAARFTVFLNPELDPQGMGYHINQALLAIGSGGLLGLGLGLSRQKHLYLPEVIGDSIFAVIAEELGFIFAALLVIALLLLAFRGLRIARNAPDDFGTYVATGIVAWIIFQSFINIGSIVGLLPLTGLPLPFISYGGSAMVVSFAAIGILINISKHTKEKR